MSYGNQSETDKLILDAKVKQDIDLDVETTNKDIDISKSERSDSYTLKIDAEDKYVKADINVKEDIKRYEDVKETKITTDTTTINFTENMKKDIDISVWNVEVDVKASNIIQNATVHADQDVNDLETSHLINVAQKAELTMDDFNLDLSAIGDSFNGAGNDSVFSVNQSII